MLLAEGHCHAHVARHVQAVAQEEVQQVEHDEEAHHHFEGVLADGERLGGEELAALEHATDDAVAQAVEVADTQAVQLALEEVRQQLLELVEVGADVQLAGLDPVIEVGPLLHQHQADQQHRQHRDQHADGQGDHRREIAASAQAQGQPTLQGREDHRQHHGPEHGTVERQEYPAEGQGYHYQQQDQRAVFQLALRGHGGARGIGDLLG
ncbi:hypothetical protein D3C72_1490030 [compost metagenome]